MQPIQLGRMRIHKVHEMDSPVPLLSQLPGTTADDMRRLLTWGVDGLITNRPDVAVRVRNEVSG